MVHDGIDELTLCVTYFTVWCLKKRAVASRAVASVISDAGNIETIACDPGQHGIGPTINTGHRVASVHRALADRYPWPKFFGEIDTSPPRREADYAGVVPGSEGEHVHGGLMFSGCVAFRAVSIGPT